MAFIAPICYVGALSLMAPIALLDWGKNMLDIGEPDAAYRVPKDKLGKPSKYSQARAERDRREAEKKKALEYEKKYREHGGLPPPPNHGEGMQGNRYNEKLKRSTDDDDDDESSEEVGTSDNSDGETFDSSLYYDNVWKQFPTEIAQLSDLSFPDGNISFYAFGNGLYGLHRDGLTSLYVGDLTGNEQATLQNDTRFHESVKNMSIAHLEDGKDMYEKGVVDGYDTAMETHVGQMNGLLMALRGLLPERYHEHVFVEEPRRKFFIDYDGDNSFERAQRITAAVEASEEQHNENSTEAEDVASEVKRQVSVPMTSVAATTTEGMDFNPDSDSDSDTDSDSNKLVARLPFEDMDLDQGHKTLDEVLDKVKRQVSVPMTSVPNGMDSNKLLTPPRAVESQNYNGALRQIRDTNHANCGYEGYEVITAGVIGLLVGSILYVLVSYGYGWIRGKKAKREGVRVQGYASVV